MDTVYMIYKARVATDRLGFSFPACDVVFKTKEAALRRLRGEREATPEVDVIEWVESDSYGNSRLEMEGPDGHWVWWIVKMPFV